MQSSIPPMVTRIRVTLGFVTVRFKRVFQDQASEIAPEHLPFIFDRFYRAAPLNSGDTQSGGLGLAYCAGNRYRAKAAPLTVRARWESVHFHSDITHYSSPRCVLESAPKQINFALRHHHGSAIGSTPTVEVIQCSLGEFLQCICIAASQQFS